MLIIEDNADLRDMYAEILAIGGHAARAVETAEEAIVAIRAERPEVAVLDLGIAGGAEPVVDALRQGAPVALILASGARDLAERAAALGALCLQKPFAPEALLQAVERATTAR
ncbi:Nitrogen regulation protein NtrX [Minicystis rosea]|nr:Nitrogen regulation protein NtrX [Minicystis rosea]